MGDKDIHWDYNHISIVMIEKKKKNAQALSYPFFFNVMVYFYSWDTNDPSNSY